MFTGLICLGIGDLRLAMDPDGTGTLNVSRSGVPERADGISLRLRADVRRSENPP